MRLEIGCPDVPSGKIMITSVFLSNFNNRKHFQELGTTFSGFAFLRVMCSSLVQRGKHTLKDADRRKAVLPRHATRRQKMYGV